MSNRLTIGCLACLVLGISSGGWAQTKPANPAARAAESPAAADTPTAEADASDAAASDTATKEAASADPDPAAAEAGRAEDDSENELFETPEATGLPAAAPEPVPMEPLPAGKGRDERGPDGKMGASTPGAAKDEAGQGAAGQPTDPALVAPDDRPRTPAGTVRWEDAEDMGAMLGSGSIEVCESLTTPLGLLPYVGTVVGLVFELACLYPGALAVDYVSLFHGNTDSILWQATLAVILAKVWRVATRFAAIAAITVAAATTLGGAGLFLGVGFFAGYGQQGLLFIPVTVASVLFMSGITYILLRKARKAGQSLIFEWVYEGLTEEFESEESQAAAQETAYAKPPLNWVERAWVLLAMADGSDPSSSWYHLIPVVGRVMKAGDSAEALKGNMRKVSKDVINEAPEDLSLMDATVDTLALVEGGLGALAEAGLIVGGGLATLGLALIAVQALFNPNIVLYSVATTAVGISAVGFAGAGIAFLLLREVPKLIRPFAVAYMYGPLPYEWFEDDDEEGEDDDDDTEAGDDSELEEDPDDVEEGDLIGDEEDDELDDGETGFEVAPRHDA